MNINIATLTCSKKNLTAHPLESEEDTCKTQTMQENLLELGNIFWFGGFGFPPFLCRIVQIIPETKQHKWLWTVFLPPATSLFFLE